MASVPSGWVTTAGRLATVSVDRIATLGMLMIGADMNEPNGPGIGDREGGPRQVVQLELSGACLVGNGANAPRQPGDTQPVCTRHVHHDKAAFVEIDGNTQIHAAVERLCALFEIEGAVDHRVSAEGVDRGSGDERQVGERVSLPSSTRPCEPGAPARHGS